MRKNHLNPKTGFYHLTMKLKAFKIVVLLLISFTTTAQEKISGRVNEFSGIPIAEVNVYNKTNGKSTTTDAEGKYILEIKTDEKNTVVFYSIDYEVLEVVVASTTSKYNVILQKINLLNEIVLMAQKDKIFALNRLKDVDETAIYAGKKTEVISVEKLTANKSTNNARQIFGQVVGLTINENSDGGLQLSIGGRGLNPNRTSNFNTRQNGYDISADVLGYPESYYATPTEALDEVQVIRGAASLQYGTQFGGLVNFKIKSPSKKPIEIQTRNTIGSFGLFTNFTSLSGTKDKFSYYTFYNYKKGDGFRDNSKFESKNYFANLNYQFNDKTSVHFDYTYFTYLAQQAGGLTDKMFDEDIFQSNRKRNWFEVNWNLFALQLKHKVTENSNFSLQLFGLNAERNAVGYRDNRVSSNDVDGSGRDLILGDFVNWGAEARYLTTYEINDNKSAFLLGAKYYQSKNNGIQGPGSSGSDANFNLATDEFPTYASQSNYEYPNLNFSVFGENMFKLTSNFSVTPGFRFEKIKTQAIGSYRRINTDLAGNVILDELESENNVKDRNFVLLGLGLSYKAKNNTELYGNISQNYRSVTFNDIRTVTPSQVIAQDITDEKGFTADLGFRGQIRKVISFDGSIFALYYNDKIGEYQGLNPNGAAAVVRIRDNVGTALNYGIETFIDWDISQTFFMNNENFKWTVFTNTAITDSKYLKSDIPNIKGNKVEFVPNLNLKTGMNLGYKNFLSNIQFMHLSEQFTNANNSKTDENENTFGVFGQIPSYFVFDFSASYKYKNWKLEAGINNFTNEKYFTRRATGYPGPGIIPSETRSFYTTLELNF
jgi:Fe(3+) dicitrate transport protein